MKRLRLATKLALAIVPISVVALAAGALVAKNALDRAEHEQRASVAAAVAANAMDTLVAFSEEHSLALEMAVGNAEGGIETRQTATDTALDRLSTSVRELVPLASGQTSGIAASILGDTNQVGRLVEQLRQVDPTSEQSTEVVGEIGRRLISVVTQATFYLGDETRAREGEGAVALARASFASLQEELLIVQHDLTRSIDDETFAQQMLVLESTVEDWINTAAEVSPTVQARGFTRTQVLAEGEGFTLDTFPTERNAVLADAASDILVRVSGSADAIAAEARAEAGTVGAIVVGALLAAALTALAVGRSTTKRVRSITAAAHHVAEVDLPRMVDSLSNPSGVLEATTPVDLDKSGRDEVADLARSFSTLHTTLVEVANRQMDTLRRGVSDIFVTLARRNRSLVDRQLALVDQLESKEEDPEVLDGYFKLDHLATRMRRNAESLLVLAGTESPRMWSEPIEMGDVVRAALGEVDEYQRVEVLAMEPALLTGRAVSDLSHLISELLDNATQFSPPNERVRVTGLFDDAGYVITIADSGVGMSAERMAELNQLIENPPVLGLALEPTLGMYVVARLAMRHGIKVRLVPGVPGTTVRVTLPRELLETAAKVAPPSGGVDSPLSAPSAPAVAAPAEPAVAVSSTNGGPRTHTLVPPAPTPTVEGRSGNGSGESTTAVQPPGPGPVTSSASPRHIASPEQETVEQSSPSNDQRPTPGSLPTRLPGTSYRESTETIPSTAPSRSGATGIRSALDGYRQGREIATRKEAGGDGDEPSREDEEQ